MWKSSPKEAQNRETPWTILKLLRWTTSYFESKKIEAPRASAEILLAKTLEINRIDLYLRYDQPLYPQELARFKFLIKKRAKREPVAYIVGQKEFWSMDLAVTPDVLIPRPETECLVEQALVYAPKENSGKCWKILDLGTGSGSIVLALASQNRHHCYFASDISHKALRVAEFNAKKNHLSSKICFFAGNWFDPLKKSTAKFDMIVSNPPYVQTDLIEKLEPEITCYEPWGALDGGENGLDCLALIINQASNFLYPGGLLILEMGYDQRLPVEYIARSTNEYEFFSFVKDYAGHDRVAVFKKKLTKQSF